MCLKKLTQINAKYCIVYRRPFTSNKRLFDFYKTIDTKEWKLSTDGSETATAEGVEERVRRQHTQNKLMS